MHAMPRRSFWMQRCGLASLCCVVSLSAVPSAVAWSDDQRWVYNASLVWNDMFIQDSEFGFELKAFADQFSEMIRMTYRALLEYCAKGAVEAEPLLGQGSACPDVMDCDMATLREFVIQVTDLFQDHTGEVLRRGFRNNLASTPPQASAIFVGEHELDMTAHSHEAGRELVMQTALRMRASIADFGYVPRCEEFVGALLDESGDRCLPSLLEGLNCLHGLSDVARSSMAMLHAAQISAVAAGSVGPMATTFNSRHGLHRDEMLLSLLADLAGRPGKLRAAEVGVDDGRTSLSLLKDEALGLHLLLVDPFEYATSGYFATHSKDHVEGGAEEVWAKLQPFRSRSALLTQSSLEAAEVVAPGCLDLVFIDADHGYEAVAEDLRAWRPKLRKGGVLAGHDFSLHWPGTVGAVREFAAEIGATLMLGPDTVWWFHL